MVKKREIKIEILSDGRVQINVLNAEGAECLEWTQEVEQVLGGDVSRELKESYYVSNNQSEESRVG